MEKTNKKHISNAQIIIVSFLLLILLGAFLLCLPISSVSGEWTSFSDAFFTATSAACVTGLVVRDTALYWSAFGQTVILALIQIGGLGVVTFAVLLSALAGKKVGLSQRSVMQESVSAPDVGSVVPLTRFIVKAVFLVEGIGAALLCCAFCPRFGVKGIWYAVFHSISAFCNAGFDLMGEEEGAYSSLTAFASDPLVSITIMLLVIIGGIGFFTLRDIREHKHRLSHYSLQSKVILITSATLIILPALYFFVFEYSSQVFGERLLTSLFSAVSARTAGFNTVNVGTLTQCGALVTMFLMLVGGAPSSTAGGMKVTTLAVLGASALSVFGKKKQTKMFSRRIPDDSVSKASAVAVFYLALVTVAGIAIFLIEGVGVFAAFFEACSALGTVGMSLGITSSLGLASRIILSALMFVGRVGGFTVVFAASGKVADYSNYPEEKITIF